MSTIEDNRFYRENESMKNFVPTVGGEIKKRIGFQHIPFKRRGFIKRIISWWNGEPHNVSSIITHQGNLWAATDKGLYYFDGSHMKRVPIAKEKASEN